MFGLVRPPPPCPADCENCLEHANTLHQPLFDEAIGGTASDPVGPPASRCGLPDASSLTSSCNAEIIGSSAMRPLSSMSKELGLHCGLRIV